MNVDTVIALILFGGLAVWFLWTWWQSRRETDQVRENLRRMNEGYGEDLHSDLARREARERREADRRFEPPRASRGR